MPPFEFSSFTFQLVSSNALNRSRLSTILKMKCVARMFEFHFGGRATIFYSLQAISALERWDAFLFFFAYRRSFQ